MRLWLLIAVVLTSAPACTPASSTVRPKLMVLAFDGLDPELTARLIAQGRLPHLAALAAAHGLHRVETTPGAEALSAWTSFSTGTNPGHHGVFDVVERDPTSYRPQVSGLTARPPARLLDRWWREGAAYTGTRATPPFWTVAGAAGVRSSIIGVPGTFPPEPIPHGEMLAGLPLPDMRGGVGGYTMLTTGPVAGVGPAETFGGTELHLTFDRNVARVELPGIVAPEALTVPVVITWNREVRTANVEVDGETVHLAEGQRSRWIAVSIPLGPLADVQGLIRFHLFRAGNDMQLLASPIHWHPAAPPSPISSPARFSADLFERLGPFRTLPWPDASWALQDGRLDEATFLDDTNDSFDDRAQTILSRMDSRGWDLLVAVVDTLDDVQRMMWRTIDSGHPGFDPAVAGPFSAAISDAYRRADSLVGDVRARLPADAALIVMSAYGTHTFRAAVDLNAWLVSRGYMTRRAGLMAAPTLASLTNASVWADAVDWDRTQAYAFGNGQIFANLRGREPQGIVSAGPDHEALLARLAGDLKALTDPATGRPVMARVRRGPEVYEGPLADRAPDLVAGFAAGYRVSWSTLVGGSGPRVIELNLGRWSADHASVDDAVVPGVFVSTLGAPNKAVRIVDLAATILRYFGVAPAPAMAQTPLF